MDKSKIRDAATIIVVRHGADGPAILMGQRGSQAAFMPSKYVFPGGAVDEVDHDIDLARDLPRLCAERLASQTSRPPRALAAAAIRELWEETGQILGLAEKWDNAPQGWRGFAASGHRPDAGALRFAFRAITPPGRPRRFDARFFMADAAALCSDPDDFSGAEEELSHLHWVPLAEARTLDLPFITEVVLAEITSLLSGKDRSEGVPFFMSNEEEILIERLGGARPLSPEGLAILGG